MNLLQLFINQFLFVRIILDFDSIPVMSLVNFIV